MFTVDQKDLPNRLKSYTMLDGTPIPNYIVVDIINAAIEAGLVSPPCYYIAYPSGMPVMHEPGEPIQIFPGKCSNPHERHWKGQTE